MTGRIITDLPKHTAKQGSAALKPGDMPKCFANPGARCSGGLTDFMIKGYDDQHRCMGCNQIHVELVMKEAGESSPGSAPQFVSPRLDKKANNERSARMSAMYDRLEAKGHSGRPSEASMVPVRDGDPVDMMSHLAKDEHGTRADGISEEERKQRILAKYGKRTGGAKR